MFAGNCVPSFIVEYFLLGRTRHDAIEQFLQDGGIVTDVWLEFARDLTQPVRVLIAPAEGHGAIDLGYSLHRYLKRYRERVPATGRLPTTVSPLENYVAATIYVDELLHVLLPLTQFYRDKGLEAINRKVAQSDFDLETYLDREIRVRLGSLDDTERPELQPTDNKRHWRVIEAAPVVALIGIFALARSNAGLLPADPSTIDPRQPQNVDAFNRWVLNQAEFIAHAATEELKRTPVILHDSVPPAGAGPHDIEAMISRVFLDRKASPTQSEAICTVKADAAQLLFNITCKKITWAIIDTGIASTHPAFFDHDAAKKKKVPAAELPSRVRATYDFTLIDQIRNYDLIDHDANTADFRAEIERVATLLADLPADRRNPDFRGLAVRNLTLIAEQLRLRLRPDWRLIEELIEVEPDDGKRLLSDHGTHVAGTLGGDWRQTKDGPAAAEQTEEVVLRGICPDINLYDLRVIPVTKTGGELRATESAIVAALEFVQYINRRSMADAPVVHGVNISLSIPHDVRNYGCGATPVCLACDRLVGAGVVVVAAAGNRGWNEQETGFGNFVFCSITDPGNARNVITVGATHRLKPHVHGISFFSSRGPTGDGRTKPDLVAPGEQIRGPVRGGADVELSGTSMAAPYVSGAAAMLMARRPELIGQSLDVKKVLCDSATDLERERYFQGHGLLDVLRALQLE
jgi:hypothetical protein